MSFSFSQWIPRLPKNFPHWSIPETDGIHLGRVVVGKNFRGEGAGRTLVEEAIRLSQELFPKEDLHAQAQAYLKDFYASFGFEAISEIYEEDGIPHLDMVLKLE